MRVGLVIVITCAVGVLGGVALACGTILGTDTPDENPVPNAQADATPSGDVTVLTPEPVDPEGAPPPVLLDAGCVDAAFAESFEEATFPQVWSKTLTAGGSVELDPDLSSVGPTSLRIRLDPQPSGLAYATRSVCPPSSSASGTIITCAFSLRIDSSTNGDVGLFELRQTTKAGQYAVARVKAREILFLTPGDGGQRVDRTSVPFITMADKKFRLVEVEISASEYVVKVDGAKVATLAIPTTATMSVDQVRAGIASNSGPRDPGWDIHIDELRCSFRPP